MKTLKPLLLTITFVVIHTAASAQCVMCKAAAESSLESGKSGIALGLNDGIFYLAAFPYMIVFILIFIYKHRQHKIKQREEAAV